MAERDGSVDPDGASVPAALVLGRWLTVQVAELRRCRRELGSDDPQRVPVAVHDARVACRRLRSGLATYRPLVDTDVTDPVRDELAWLAGSLGGVRDTHVVRDRLRRLLDDLPGDEAAGTAAARQRIARRYAARAPVAGGDVGSIVASDRCGALLRALDVLAAEPPFTALAATPAIDSMRPPVWRKWRRLERLVTRLPEVQQPDGLPDDALHEVRKAAKRLRYSAEILRTDFKKQTRPLSRLTKTITEVLGEHQDTVVSRHELDVLLAAARAEGESPTVYESLHSLESTYAAERAREFHRVWSSLDRARLSWWQTTD